MPSTSDNSSPGDAPARRANAARLRQVRARRRRWYAVAFSVSVLAAGVWLVLGTNVPQFFVSRVASDGAATAAPVEHRTGMIVVQTDANRCQQREFDNDTGRVLDSAAPCGSGVVLDAHGVPVPVGTVHRLGAISKSFSGN